MSLRKGKPKLLLDSSIDCALLAVEIYNKPRTPFRVECYITHMIMAWTRLFHAHFQREKGEVYFYKDKDGKHYKKVDGDRKAWELTQCIKEYRNLNDAVRYNLEFFIKLRNKIEHRMIDRDTIGVQIFGECQSMLYNYENELVRLFGENYALNEHLTFSLQFSRVRIREQKVANKKSLTREYKELFNFISEFRKGLSDSVFESQEYSIKLIQMPKISNTNRNDLAIQFVNWSNLSDQDKEVLSRLTTVSKDKTVKQEVINPGKLKPGHVIEKVNEKIDCKINMRDFQQILSIFNIRHYKEFHGTIDKYLTNTKYCHYDEVHDDYVYTDGLVEFLVRNISLKKITKLFWNDNHRDKKKVEICSFEEIA